MGSGGRPCQCMADLRAFVLTGETTRVWASGLTRYSTRADSMAVISSQGGGFKDTWVLGRKHATRRPPQAPLSHFLPDDLSHSPLSATTARAYVIPQGTRLSRRSWDSHPTWIAVFARDKCAKPCGLLAPRPQAPRFYAFAGSKYVKPWCLRRKRPGRTLSKSHAQEMARAGATPSSVTICKFSYNTTGFLGIRLSPNSHERRQPCPQEDSQASAHTPAEGANPPPKPTQPRDSEPTQQVAYPRDRRHRRPRPQVPRPHRQGG